MISFARGAPAPECLDCRAARRLRPFGDRGDPSVLAYGAGGGYGPLREWLGARHGVEPARVIVTNGGLQGFVFYAEELLAARPGRVLVEAPTYDRPLKILARLGAEAVPVPMDEQGLDPDALAETLDAGATSFVYTIPTFQNPSGRTLSTARRERVVELAAERGVPVLEDDPYGLVRYEGDGAAVAARARGRRARHLRLFLLEDGRAGRPRRLVRRPGRPGGAVRGARRLDIHLAAVPHSGDRARADRPRRVRAKPGADPRPAARSAATRCATRSSASWPAWRPGASRRAATSSGSISRTTRRSCSTRAEAAGVTFVKGSDFFPDGRGGERVRPARVQLRLAVGDRRGRLDARLAPARLTPPVSCESSTPPTRPASSESRITQISEVRAPRRRRS